MSATATTLDMLADLIQRCRRQQQAWASLPIRQRLRPVRAFRHLLVRECDRLCAAVHDDIGKPATEALVEVLPLADACRFLEREAARLLRPRRVPWSQRPWAALLQGDTVHRRPRGVVGIIGTWNYPLFLNGVQLVQALTAGNGVLWKPSEVAPASAAVLFELLRQAGYPPDLVHLLEATREAGPQLAGADVDHIVFTGSAAVGRVLAANLGRRLVSSTLELSGCDAMFVLDDADVALAAQAAWFGCTLNRGQTCLAVRRAFVPRPLYPAFADALKGYATSAAPVRLALPAAARDAERFVQEAAADGATVLAAPSPPEAPWCRPAVVLDARPDMALCREASFAPVMAVLPYDSLDEAVDMDAHCDYALGTSIFTRDPDRAAQLAARLRAGAVTVNDVIAPTGHPATPFGGRAASGWGVTQGAEGLLEMTVPQVVSVSGGSFRPHYDLVGPKGEQQSGLLRALLEWSHGATFGERWRALRRLLREAWRLRGQGERGA